MALRPSVPPAGLEPARLGSYRLSYGDKFLSYQ